MASSSSIPDPYSGSGGGQTMPVNGYYFEYFPQYRSVIFRYERDPGRIVSPQEFAGGQNVYDPWRVMELAKIASSPDEFWKLLSTKGKVKGESVEGPPPAPPVPAPSSYTGGMVSSTSYAAPSVSTFAPQWFEGQWYTDPQALAEAMLASGQRKVQERESSIEEQYRKNIADLERLKQRLLEELPKARKQAYSSLRGYYHALSPDWYQSRQAVAEQELEENIKAQEEDKMNALQKAVEQARSSLEEAQRNLQDWLEGWREKAMGYASYGWKEGQPLPQFEMPEVKYQRADYSIDIPALLEQIRRAPGSRMFTSEEAVSQATKRKKTTKGEETGAIKKFLYSSI